ncbi:hypothetical protein [Dulcicalothrix desertica]|uniref:hypothetical protein n=1 Tax=Dulcicalothrix desertica TaxID=32056 RepID=UPI000F8CA603|nr:hypothetical protein [Dulcicalothrix desertica]
MATDKTDVTDVYYIYTDITYTLQTGKTLTPVMLRNEASPDCHAEERSISTSVMLRNKASSRFSLPLKVKSQPVSPIHP